MLKRFFAGNEKIETSQEYKGVIDAVLSAGKTPTIALGKMLWWERHAKDTGYTKMAEWIKRVRESAGKLKT